MRTKYTYLLKSIFIIVIVLTVFSACKKDEDDPDYVGSWVVTGTINDGSQNLEMKDVITFTKGSYNEKYQVKIPGSSTWIDYMGFKGTLSVNGKTMNVTVTEAGLSSFDAVTGVPTGVITYYKSNNTNFTTFMNTLEMPTTFQSEYTVSGSELTIKTDLNADADFSDDGEVAIYTRQQ